MWDKIKLGLVITGFVLLSLLVIILSYPVYLVIAILSFFTGNGIPKFRPYIKITRPKKEQSYWEDEEA